MSQMSDDFYLTQEQVDEFWAARLPKATIADSEICPAHGRPKFRFVGTSEYTAADGKIPLTKSFEITPENCNVDDICRVPSFVMKLNALKQRVENSMPDNVQITYGISPWGGCSADDIVTVRVFDDRGHVIAKDHFWRTINTEDVLNPEGFIPKPLRDSFFLAKVYRWAQKLAQESRGHTAEDPLVRARRNDGFQSLM